MPKPTLDEELDDIRHPSREELDKERSEAAREIRYDVKYLLISFAIVIVLVVAGLLYYG